MDNRPVIVLQPQSPFARHARRLGFQVLAAQEDGADDVRVGECQVFHWDMASLRQPLLRSLVSDLLARVPADCTRILDFTLVDPLVSDRPFVRTSLSCCDLLRIDIRQLPAVCRLMGLRSKYALDQGFELMSVFRIATLALSNGKQGCSVLHDNAVSEKRGHFPFGVLTAEEIDGAFIAAYYAASLQPGKGFSECHRQGFAYVAGLI